MRILKPLLYILFIIFLIIAFFDLKGHTKYAELSQEDTETLERFINGTQSEGTETEELHYESRKIASIYY